MTDGVEKELFATTYKVEGDSLTLAPPKEAGPDKPLLAKITQLTDDECILTDSSNGEKMVLRRPGFVGSEPIANTQTKLDLKLIGLSYRSYEDNENKPPSKVDELASYVSGGGPVIKDMKDGNLIVYWNVNISKLGAAASTTILGYEKDTPTKGGLVVMADAEVKLMTADEFKKAAKPHRVRN
jgi:hypothetical protein